MAYNFFTIVGPAEDPAQLEGKTVSEALFNIVSYGENMADQSGQTKIFVSRGDNSGTHTKEIALWKAAGYNYTLISKEPWYASVGSGMGDTLNVANQKSAYTLSDIGTFLCLEALFTSRYIPGSISRLNVVCKIFSLMACSSSLPRFHQPAFPELLPECNRKC